MIKFSSKLAISLFSNFNLKNFEVYRTMFYLKAHLRIILQERNNLNLKNLELINLYYYKIKLFVCSERYY